MDRLTQINGNNEIYCIVDDKKIAIENVDMLKICQRLKLYEDLDEQGLLLRLPCKIGDTVYLIKPNSDRKIIPRTADMMFLGVLWEDYGKEWFLTKAEAEQKLKEVEV